MGLCPHCGKEMGLWAALVGQQFHEICRQQAQAKIQAAGIQAARQKESERIANEKGRREWLDSIWKSIEGGNFPTVNPGGGFLPEMDETCHFSISGVKRATFFPQVLGSPRPHFTWEGIIRSDGYLPKEEGTLHITNRRLAFLGVGGTVNLLLAKLLQASCSRDVATFAVSNRTSAVHFVLDPEIATALVAAVQMLAEKAKREEPLRKSRKNKLAG